MKARRRLRLALGLSALGAVAACVVDPLNPQPLPPGPEDNKAVFMPDSGVTGPLTNDAASPGAADSGSRTDVPDGAPPTNATDGGVSDADGGDAGDAGDADADAGPT